MTESKIEWTGRSDWNPVRGCSRVSPGCGGPGPHGGCYAEAMAARFSLSAAEVEARWRADPKNAGKAPPTFADQWGHGFAEMQNGKPRWTGKVELQEDRLLMPLKWRKPGFVFPNSTSDFFHEALPDTAIDKIFATMAMCPHLTFQVLTKRPERAREYLSDPLRRNEIELAAERMKASVGQWCSPKWSFAWPLPNLWLGVSAERQQEADERIPLLLQTPAAVRFVSAEPLLGALDLTDFVNPVGLGRSRAAALDGHPRTNGVRPALDWVIPGGESGPNARPFDIAWADSIIDQCKAAGVACFMKQLGSNPTSDGYPLHLKSRNGGDPSEWPDRLNVRAMPKGIIYMTPVSHFRADR